MNNAARRAILALIVACGTGLHTVSRAESRERADTLRVVQAAVSAVAFDLAKGWSAGDKGRKLDWWLAGNEKTFATCTGQVFIANLAEWQKDELWLNGSDSSPNWYKDELNTAVKQCVRLFVDMNLDRCKKLGDSVECKARSG